MLPPAPKEAKEAKSEGDDVIKQKPTKAMISGGVQQLLVLLQEDPKKQDEQDALPVLEKTEDAFLAEFWLKIARHCDAERFSDKPREGKEKWNHNMAVLMFRIMSECTNDAKKQLKIAQAVESYLWTLNFQYVAPELRAGKVAQRAFSLVQDLVSKALIENKELSKDIWNKGI
jgi:hypothetical protein